LAGPHDEPTGRENLRDAPRDLAVQFRLLARQVEEGIGFCESMERREF
jgi:hypothetical protein